MSLEVVIKCVYLKKIISILLICRDKFEVTPQTVPYLAGKTFKFFCIW